MTRLRIAIACAAVAVGSFLLVSALAGDRTGDPPSPERPGGEARAASPRPPPPARSAAPPAPEARSSEGPDGDAGLLEAALAAEMQEEAAREAILGPAREGDVPLARRLARYRHALREHLAGTPREDLLRARGMLTEVFFRLEEVQEELAAMQPGARQSAINHVRREMGFPEEDVRRLEALDARREARWQNGHAYMEERRRVVGTFEGEALEEELRALREAYFGFEAQTIAREEQAGFFRYERPRIYGRN